MEPLFKPISIDESIEEPLDIEEDYETFEKDRLAEDDCGCDCDYFNAEEEDDLDWLGGEDGVD